MAAGRSALWSGARVMRASCIAAAVMGALPGGAGQAEAASPPLPVARPGGASSSAAAAPAPSVRGAMILPRGMPAPRPVSTGSRSVGAPAPGTPIPSPRPRGVAAAAAEALNADHVQDVADDGPELPVGAVAPGEVTLGTRTGLAEGVAVLGIYGSPGDWRALLRWPSGERDYAVLGGKVGGWTVVGISGEAVTLTKGRETVHLAVPEG